AAALPRPRRAPRKRVDHAQDRHRAPLESGAPLRRADRIRVGDAMTPTLADLEGIYAGAPWVGEAALARTPFAGTAALERAMVEAVREAPREAQLALLRAHAT